MDTATVTVLFSIVSGVVALVGSVYVARRFQKLGGGEAQDKLNEVYKELTEAFEDKIKVLESRIAERDSANQLAQEHLVALEAEIETMRKDRLRLQRDIIDLHAEVLLLQKKIQQQGAAQDVRGKAQDERGTAQDERAANGNGDGGKP